MNTMKAVRLFEFGGPDQLRYGDHPMPEVAPTDVLVKVLATSVSRWDIKYRTGEVHEFYGKSTGHHGGIHGRRAFAGQRATISAWSPSSWRKGASACRSTRRCRSPRPWRRTPCSNTARRSWAASCCIPGTMCERWREERWLLCRAQKSVAMPLTSQSP